MKPSDFSNASAMGSVLQKSEAETVARNIMTILKRTGDTWRKLSYEEYKKERLKDCNKTSFKDCNKTSFSDYSGVEEKYFNEVIDYCISPETAKLFAPDWRRVAEKGN